MKPKTEREIFNQWCMENDYCFDATSDYFYQIASKSVSFRFYVLKVRLQELKQEILNKFK